MCVLCVCYIPVSYTHLDVYKRQVYENGVPQILLTEVGYVSLTDGTYHYYLKDHQGNNRVVVDEEGTVEEVNDYYAVSYTHLDVYKRQELTWKRGIAVHMKSKLTF